tara:strand:+ start:657 stop:764 length:108 start_codon:yes stop_codon:yes gene_type:complete
LIVKITKNKIYISCVSPLGKRAAIPIRGETREDAR